MSTNADLDPQQEEELRKKCKPTTDLELAGKLAEKLFGLHPVQVKMLDSYDDRNFYVAHSKSSTNHRSETGGLLCDCNASTGACSASGKAVGTIEKFLLKFHNGVESERHCVLEAQNCIMQYLTRKGFHCPVPVLSCNMSLIENASCVTTGCDKQKCQGPYHAVRLLKWVEGKTLNEIGPTHNRLRLAGKYLGRLRSVLDDFDHRGCHRNHLWDIAQTSGLRKYIDALGDMPDIKKIVEDVIVSFEALPTRTFRKGVLMADFNDANIIFDKDGDNVHGVIDFGDTVHSACIFDVAIAMAYATLVPPSGGDCISAAAAFLSGVCESYHLEFQELMALRTLIGCRLATSVTLGAFSAMQDKSDNEYLLLHAAPGRRALKNFWNEPPERISKAFLQAAELGNQRREFNSRTKSRCRLVAVLAPVIVYFSMRMIGR